MESVLLQIAARHMRPILIVLSLIVLYRGHNEPGGGFIGGLMFGSSFILYSMAFGVPYTRKNTFINPVNLTAVGLLVALVSGLPAVFSGYEYMTGAWFTFLEGTSFELKLGTPLLFDVGVYFTVAGMLMLVIFSLMED